MKKRFCRFLALLLSCAVLAGTAVAVPATTQMAPSVSKLMVDGKAVSCAAYDVKAANGNSNTFFKLRDVAAALSGTAAQFAVDWDGPGNAVTAIKGKAYTPVGGELSGVALTAGNGTLSTSALIVNGVRTYLTAYALDGNNYFMLRDLGMALDFGVDWDGKAGAVVIDTAKGYHADGGKLTVSLASEPGTLDPALVSSADEANMVSHFFEGLMRWNDDGTGNAVLGPGQASGFDKVVNADGTITYTFHLKDGIRWSDGKSVKAGDFAYAWRRLADPATAAPYSYVIEMVKGWDEVGISADASQLAVSAPDDKTFVVTLKYDCPYFLEVTAHSACMPVRQDIIEAYGDDWYSQPTSYVSNGPYYVAAWRHNSDILSKRNRFYPSGVGPGTLQYILTDDINRSYTEYLAGNIDFTVGFPGDKTAELLATGKLNIQDYLGTYYACFNTERAPFNDARVRQAFSLVIDRNYIVEQVTQTGEIPADAYVALGAQDAGGYATDFRDSGNSYWSTARDDYEANCAKARQLLAEAGYPNGQGFPAVNYIYNTSDEHRAIAQALQVMWQSELGIKVTMSNMEWNAFIDARQRGEYNIARHGWIADYRDPQSFLSMWVSGNGNNDANYSNAEYDRLVRSATSDADPAHRMQSLHAAEDILMKDMAVAPIFFYTNAYLQSDKVTGVYYSPLGLWFFDKAVITK